MSNKKEKIETVMTYSEWKRIYKKRRKKRRNKMIKLIASYLIFFFFASFPLWMFIHWVLFGYII